NRTGIEENQHLRGVREWRRRPHGRPLSVTLRVPPLPKGARKAAAAASTLLQPGFLAPLGRGGSAKPRRRGVLRRARHCPVSVSRPTAIRAPSSPQTPRIRAGTAPAG